MIIKVESDEAILATRDVMRQLRPHINAHDYLSTVRRLTDTEGIRLAAVVEQGEVRSVATYRFLEMLHCGRMLYLDDLVTDGSSRSKGHGRELIQWLKRQAIENGSAEFHLDSRVDRAGAHRFYFREQFAILGFHFGMRL